MCLHQSFWNLALLCIISGLSASLEIIVAYSHDRDLISDAYNETSILQATQSLTSFVDWHPCSIPDLSLCLSNFPNSSILLDLSSELDIQNSISQLCRSYMIIHLVLQSSMKFDDEWTFSVTSTKEKQVQAFTSVLKYLNWTQGVGFINKKNYDIKEIITSYYSSEFNFLTVESETSIEELVYKVVVRQGATVYSILTSATESLEIQNGLKNSKLLTAGNGIILDQESGYQCNIDGSLIVTEFGQELVVSVEEFMKNSIINTISYILSQNSKETRQEIRSILKNSQNNCRFSLVNIQKGERIIVGSILNNSLILEGNLTFPGSSATIPKSTKKILNVSMSAGPSNPNALPALSGVIGAWGTYLAMNEINEGHGLIPNFQLAFFNFDCGSTVYNAKFAYTCYKNDIDKFGLAHIPPFSSSVTLGVIKTFKQLNVAFPVVGCSNTEPSLNVTKDYPMFTRVWFSASYGTSLLSVLVKVMGWQKISILYQNDSWAISKSWYLNPAIEKQGLEIVNPESSWYIPANLDREGLKNYTSLIQTIIDSQARLLILTVQYPMCNFLLEMFYDLGLRKGDLIIFATYLDMLTYIGNNDTYTYKRLELGIPMFRLILSSWVGEIGQRTKQRVIEIHKENPLVYTCPYYDGAYQMAHALDYMINRGQDYTDPYKLEAVIRIQKFVGCTGTIATEPDNNDRIAESYDIEGNGIDSTGSIYTEVIGQLKPFSLQILTIENPIVYPDGTNVKPSDLRNQNSKCPFPDKKIKTFEKGRGLLFGICFFVALITIFITVFIWKKWWNISIEQLKQKEEISVQDTIVGVSIIVEFFQYASMGPDISLLSSIFAKFSDALSLDLDDIIKLENGVFWIVVDITFGGIVLWGVLCAVVLLRLDEKWRVISVFRFLSWLADYLMPILGNLCFIPFISICLDIFLCDQSIGDNFTESFLARDCYYFCWKSEHLVYAILSFLALFLYVPLAIFCRPLWQELQSMLHVKASPVYLMVKTIFQITLIVMNKTIKRSQDIAHGCIFLVALIIYTIFTFKFKPYNYGRFSWWQGLILIGVAWLAFISTISILIKHDFAALLVVLILGWFSIGMVGLYIQKKKYPSFLYRKSAKDTSTLFKFAFNFRKTTAFSKGKIVPD
ncbi:unnamed protein product [Blepharisma stoltei]|uniref:Receptor ligand binding region domain-containing protein n=1 Tax=Blepharisma stoltei TaxID=1481888 RepID=A0AAU9ITZ3_9CILI|nr:unnamed protein product [Blepharisma stoltei]